ncbi:MAG: UDP-N-acetylmuramoyl-tripeptide--D-alanyl-D-alanine ligase, partial [Candidatus Subteraquimicrobiales bacterium]|nr:UDP-N-acetylmuramoyl-tripeptide--D-alanyl-D-alanine ligase [Candidatus Subteraquimicrobiales bacterium]
MFDMKLSEIVSASQGVLIQGILDKPIGAVCTDTRTIKENTLFIPLKGENFDGHQFIKEALEKGAIGFVTEKWSEKFKSYLDRLLNEKIIVIKVEDSLKALQGLARYVRSKLPIEVVGITGSTGKTCTKDMITSILMKNLKVVSTEKNYNNEIGVPLTLLSADEKTEVMVIEMAMRVSGQIRELAEIAKPTVGLVTNIGESHYEMLGSSMKIAKTKRELVESIPYDGKVILNLDDNRFKMLARGSKAKIVTFGFSRWANYFPVNIRIDASGFYSFEMMTPKSSILINLPVVGKHNIYNALAASAAAVELGVSPDNIKVGLETCQLSEMRTQLLTTPDGIVV